MKTLAYKCSCGEDIYEDDTECVTCGKITDKLLLKEVEIAEITKEILPSTPTLPKDVAERFDEQFPGSLFDDDGLYMQDTVKSFLAVELAAQKEEIVKLVENHYEPINGKYHLIAKIKSI